MPIYLTCILAWTVIYWARFFWWSMVGDTKIAKVSCHCECHDLQQISSSITYPFCCRGDLFLSWTSLPWCFVCPYSIMPRLTRFVLALVCVYYFFSVIGMAAFSGKGPRYVGFQCRIQYKCTPFLGAYCFVCFKGRYIHNLPPGTNAGFKGMRPPPCAGLQHLMVGASRGWISFTMGTSRSQTWSVSQRIWLHGSVFN